MDKKILILTNNYIGLYSFRYELIEKLIENNYSIYCIIPDDVHKIKFSNIGCNCYNIKFKRNGKNPFSDIKLILQYKKFINKIKPNVVLTYTIKPNIYGGIVSTWLKIPYIANITGLGTAVEYKSFLQKITIPLYKLGIKKASMVFFQNKANQNFMLNNKIYKGPHCLLPGSGVNLTKFQLYELPKTKKIRFLFSGRLIKEKGICEYLESAKIIKEKYPYTEFHISGIMTKEYERTISELVSKNIIIYHGMVQDMKVIYKKIHCTIHPSYYPEGMSNTLLESCACGRPIITTNRPGCGDVLKNNYNGFLVKEKNANSVVSAIINFLNLSYDEKKQMGINARNIVENNFDRHIVIDKYMKVIKEL